MLEVENLQHFTITEVTRVRNGNITELPSNDKECAIGEFKNNVAFQGYKRIRQWMIN